MDALQPGLSVPSVSQALAPPPAPPAASSPPSDKGSGLDSLLSGIGAGGREAAKKVDALELQRMKFNPPTLDIKPFQKPKETDPIEAWGSIAMVFAGLASLKVRSHATTAMNAAAAGLNAVKQKDADAYDKAFKEWEVATKNTVEMAHFQQDAYKTLMESVEHRESIALEEGKMFDVATDAKFRVLTTVLQDPTMLKAYEAGGVKGAADLQEQRLKDTRTFELKKLELGKAGLEQGKLLLAQQIVGSDAYKNAKGPRERLELLSVVDPPKIEEQIAKLDQKEKEDAEKVKKDEESQAGRADQFYQEWLSSGGDKLPLGDRMKKMQETYSSFKSASGRVYPDPAQLAPEERGSIKQSFAAYDEKWPTITQQRGNLEGWQKLENEIKKTDPGWNPARYDLVKKAREKITIGKDADAIASYVRLNQHLVMFEDLVKHLHDGADIKAVNGLAKWWGQQTGDPNITSYETALELVGDEMVKAATGTGAAGALADRESIKKNFSASLDKEQLRANIDAVKVLVGGAIVSTLNKYRGVLTQPGELAAASGLSPEALERYHVKPDVTMARPGPVKFGGATVPIDEQGAGQAPAQPQGGGAQSRRTKDGQTAWGMNGKWFVSKDGKAVPVSELDLQ